MAVWSIKIVAGPDPNSLAEFVPQLQEGGPDGLLASTGDAVTWNNATDDAHQPWPVDNEGNPLPEDKIQPPRGQANSIYLSDEIPPHHASRPTYLCVAPAVGNQIFYCCRLHPHERGVITLTNVASTAAVTS